MNKHLKTLVAGAAIAGGLAAAPPYAQMTGQGGMTGMMGSMMSGTMPMMGMSGDVGGRTEHCNAMMQGTDGQRPNNQWRTPQPERRGQGQG
jgi:hypothetical protein